MLKIAVTGVLFVLILSLRAQDNYEIQVYEAATTTAGNTEFELHSNFSIAGTGVTENGVRPTQHEWRNTLEITQGILPDFEMALYTFTNYTPGYGYQWVGNHLRVRLVAPKKWKIPFGLGLSTEAGYQRKEYADDTWSMEIRPIIDKKLDWIYLAFNPVFGVSLQSRYNKHTPTFEPNVRISVPVSKIVSGGIEYYGNVGYVNNPEHVAQQQHQLFLASDIDFSPMWELNLGLGLGFTKATDALIFKVIIGREIDWTKKKKKSDG